MSHNMTEKQLGWIAGIIDADGSFCIHGNSGSPHIEISMTDRPTIDCLQQLIGGKVYTPTVPRENAKQYWKLTAGPTIERMLLPLIVDVMVTKKRRAEIVLELLSLRKRSTNNGVHLPEKQSELYDELRRLNKRGKAA